MTFEAESARIYFNRSGDPCKLWSIDFGPNTQEILCAGVRLCGVDSSTEFAIPAPDDPKESPSAWMHVGRCRLVLLSSGTISISRV